MLQFDQYRDYACLLSENEYFGRQEYMAMMEKEHQRLKKLEDPCAVFPKSRPSLEQRLNHVYMSRSKDIEKEYLKHIATALRAERALREYTPYINETKDEMDEMFRKVK